MINLIPNDIKVVRNYGKKNILVLRWIYFSVVLFIILLIFMGIGHLMINKAISDEQQRKQAMDSALSIDKLDKVEKEYSKFVSDVKTVTQILSNQVLYSELLKQIGKITPQGASLSSISLSSKDNALDLNFSVTSADIAPVLQLNLQDEKNKLFEKADIIQVNCQAKEQTNAACTTQLRAEYRKDAEFLFINTVGSKK